MKLKIHVKVTEKDIAKGIAHDCFECPGARATLRAVKKRLGGDFEVSAGSVVFLREVKARDADGQVIRRGGETVATTPAELRTLIGKVDEPTLYGPAEPVEFDLWFPVEFGGVPSFAQASPAPPLSYMPSIH